MYIYFTNQDVSIKFDYSGNASFDLVRIRKNIAKRFVMPHWIESSIEYIFDNSKLNGVNDTREINNIITDTIVDLNNLLIPLIRAKMMQHSDFSKLVKYANSIELADIHLTFDFNERKKPHIQTRSLNLEKLYKKLEMDEKVVDDVLKDYVQRKAEMFLDSEYMNYELADINNPYKFDVVKEYIYNNLRYVIISSFIDLFIYKFKEYLKDNSQTNMYYYVEKEDENYKVTYDVDKTMTLLDALDYAIYEDGEKYNPQILKMLNDIKDKMQEELDGLIADTKTLDDSTTMALSISVNVSAINRIKFIRDLNINPNEVASIKRFPTIMVSQTEIESSYLDGLVEMTTYDYVLEDLQYMSDLPKYKIESRVQGIIDEVLNVVDILREDSILNAYKGAKKTYLQMLDIEVERLKQNKISSTTTNHINIS